METSKVYYTDLRTSPTSNLLDKMERLVKRAGIEQLPLKDSFVAIKIHFGEPGNLAYLRPNYAARMANLLRNNGAKPFLTDCNTLYSGRRANAVDHLQSAMENGYNPISAQCQVIIGDGLKGTDCREIPLNGEYCAAPKIGTAIADADIIISMNHFKGHEQAGFGGALNRYRKLHRLQYLREALCTRRRTSECRTQSGNRLCEMRRLRTVCRFVPV